MSLVRLNIKGISYSQTQNGAYALILNEVDGDRKLPIVIGAFEAQSIAIALEKEIKPPRPLTHDLFKNFSDRFNIVVKQVIIHKLVDGVFYSSLICERDGVEEIIDARTSDSIALALRFNAPIFTYKNILDKAGIYLKVNPNEDDEATDDNILLDEVIAEEKGCIPMTVLKHPASSDNRIINMGARANLIKPTTGYGFKKMHEFNSIKKFASKRDFLMQYLVGNGGIAPFSGYIFKTSCLQAITFKSLISGKHLDVSLLASLSLT